MKKLIYLLLLLPIGIQAQNVPDIIRTTPIPATGANKNNRATVDANLKAMYALLLPRVTSNTINGAKDSSGYLFYNVITDRVVSARSMNVFDVLARVSDLNAYVPYTGATSDLNMGVYGIAAQGFRAQGISGGIGAGYQLKAFGSPTIADWQILELNTTKELRVTIPPSNGSSLIPDTPFQSFFKNKTIKFWYLANGVTPDVTSNSKEIPTTEWVKTAIAASAAGVSSFNGRTGTVTPLLTDYNSFYLDQTTAQTKSYTGSGNTLTLSNPGVGNALNISGSTVLQGATATSLVASTLVQVASGVTNTQMQPTLLYVANSSDASNSSYGKGYIENRPIGTTFITRLEFPTAATSNKTIALRDLAGTVALLSDIPVAANPTNLIGLTVNNGVATTFARSDATAALSQAIAPTWTSLHAFNAGLTATTITTSAKDNYSNTAAYGTPSALTKIPKEYADATYLQSVGVAQGVTTTGGVNPTIGLGNITPSSVGMTSVSPALGGLSASSLYLQRNIADRSNAIRSYTGTSVDWIYGDDAVTGDWYIERYSGGSAVDRPFRLNKATGIPAFLYSPTMPTATTGDNTTKGASTAFVQQELTASGRTRAFLNSNLTLALNGDYLSTTSTLYTGVLPPTTGFLTDGSKLIVVAATGTAGARISCPTGYTLVGLSGAATPGTGGVNIVNGGKVQLAPVGTNAYQYYALSGTVIVN